MIRVSSEFRAWPSAATVLLSACVLFATMIALMLAELAVTKKLPTEPAALQWIEAAAYIATSAYLLRRLPRIAGQSLRDLGLRAPTRAGLGTFALALGAIVALSVVHGVVVRALGVHHTQSGFEGFFPDVVRHARGGTLDAALTLAMTTLLIAVVAPFTEELFFRGFLLRALAVRMPWIAAAVLSSLAFAAMHADAVLFALLAGFGFVNAWAYRRSGNLVVPMLAHGTFNFASMLLGIAGAALKH